MGCACHCRKRLNKHFWKRTMASGWTVERRARQSAAIRRWRPWEHSTGPKTAGGKARCSRNAVRGNKRQALHQLSNSLRELMRASRAFAREVASLSRSEASALRHARLYNDTQPGIYASLDSTYRNYRAAGGTTTTVLPPGTIAPGAPAVPLFPAAPVAPVPPVLPVAPWAPVYPVLP